MARTLRILAFNTLSAGLYAVLSRLEAGWPSMLHAFLTSFVYASVIGTAAQLALPRLGKRLSGARPAAFWLGMGAALFACAATGSLVAGAIAYGVGLLGPGPAGPVIGSGLAVSLILAMAVGLVICLYETTRARLDATRESLRARELEIERAQRLAADARLASLESRLHPHFLFNAIAAIAGQVRESPEHAERLLIEFADLLRASLDSTQRHTQPLGDEIAVVRAYLEIEQARLGDRLRAKLDAPGDLLRWAVPPFALHTLVQNSVKHVAAARPEGAEIRVEAWRAGDRLALSVQRARVRPGRGPPGHGIDMLRARLAALFGTDAELVSAREHGSARVTMTVPPRTAFAERG